MPTKEEDTLVFCPLERVTVDIERCAACAWHTRANPTCSMAERAEARQWRSLMRLIAL